MNMIKKLSTAAVAGAMAVALASPASAAQFFSFNGTSGVYGDTSIGVSPFSKTFTFTTGKGLISATLSSVGSGVSNIDFTSVTFNGAAFDIVTTGFSEFRQKLLMPVSAGTQTIVVSGVGGRLGAFDGVLSFQAVPEPATWAMMILGLGAVGYTMRRRKVTTRVAFA